MDDNVEKRGKRWPPMRTVVACAAVGRLLLQGFGSKVAKRAHAREAADLDLGYK
jgi:hypothetical protein